MRYILNGICLSLVLLVGCESKRLNVVTAPAVKDSPMVNLDRAFGQLRILEDKGLDFSQYGDEIRVMVPVTKLFEKDSAMATRYLNYFSKAIVQIANQWPIHSLEIASFDGNNKFPMRSSVLATQRGQILVAVLDEQGINVPVVYTKSYVRKNKKGNCQNTQYNENKRIEFVFNPVYRKDKDCLSYAQAGVIGY